MMGKGEGESDKGCTGWVQAGRGGQPNVGQRALRAGGRLLPGQ